ncbi:hypothetical protein [Desertivirga brevis]|uniref:hypothetical protein n=1 Tax=Desertivirga brevis TaxID=2810310 RepID=UPI001A96EE49|nr:hypothetical protein [Pedobacter sp. SYSU D00873]
MKKITLLLLLLSIFKLQVLGQNAPQLQSADSTIIKRLLKQIDELQKQNENHSSNINALLTGKDIDAANKYTIIKQNLTNAASTFQLLNNKINILKSKTSADKLDLFIKDLNNPQSNTLGFKLDETIIKLVNENLKVGKKNTRDKIIQNVSGITKGQIVSTIANVSPAITVANSVMSLLRSASIVSDDLNQNSINQIENQLNSYVQYYVALNDGNAAFTYNLASQAQDLGVLQQKLFEQVSFFAKTLNYKLPKQNQNETLSAYLNTIFLGFDKAYVSKLFSDLERQNSSNNRINYEAILASNNGNLKEANNRLEELIGLVNQFEYQHNQYFNVYEVYNTRVLQAMDIAAANRIADPSLINQKKADLTSLKNQAVSDIKASINLPELLLSKQSIKYAARIL